MTCSLINQYLYVRKLCCEVINGGRTILPCSATKCKKELLHIPSYIRRPDRVPALHSSDPSWGITLAHRGGLRALQIHLFLSSLCVAMSLLCALHFLVRECHAQGGAHSTRRRRDRSYQIVLDNLISFFFLLF